MADRPYDYTGYEFSAQPYTSWGRSAVTVTVRCRETNRSHAIITYVSELSKDPATLQECLVSLLLGDGRWGHLHRCTSH